MFNLNYLEQSTLEYLCNLVEKGILRVKKYKGEYLFTVHPRYIDMKDKLICDFEDRAEEIAIFYIKARKNSLLDKSLSGV